MGKAHGGLVALVAAASILPTNRMNAGVGPGVFICFQTFPLRLRGFPQAVVLCQTIRADTFRVPS